MNSKTASLFSTLLFSLLFCSYSGNAQKSKTYPEFPKYEMTINATDIFTNMLAYENQRRSPRVGRNTLTIKKFRKKNKYKYLAFSIHEDNIIRARNFFFFPSTASTIRDELGQGFLFGFAIGEEFKHPLFGEKWKRSFRYEFKYLWGEKRASTTAFDLLERNTNALGFGMVWEVEYNLNETIGLSTGLGFHYFAGSMKFRNEELTGEIITDLRGWDRFALSYPNAIQVNIRFDNKKSR